MDFNVNLNQIGSQVLPLRAMCNRMFQSVPCYYLKNTFYILLWRKGLIWFIHLELPDYILAPLILDMVVIVHIIMGYV